MHLPATSTCLAAPEVLDRSLSTYFFLTSPHKLRGYTYAASTLKSACSLCVHSWNYSRNVNSQYYFHINYENNVINSWFCYRLSQSLAGLMSSHGSEIWSAQNPTWYFTEVFQFHFGCSWLCWHWATLLLSDSTFLAPFSLVLFMWSTTYPTNYKQCPTQFCKISMYHKPKNLSTGQYSIKKQRKKVHWSVLNVANRYAGMEQHHT